LQLGFTVHEVIAPNNSVTMTIFKEAMALDDAGPFTVVATNANSGTSLTVHVTTSPSSNKTEDVVDQASVRGGVLAIDSMNIGATYIKHQDNNQEGDQTTPKLDGGTLPEHELPNRNLIGVFAAFFLFLVSVLFVFAIVRKRKRDVLYHRLPTSRTVFYLTRNSNYGSCKVDRAKSFDNITL
jgi:hypothetical protein